MIGTIVGGPLVALILAVMLLGSLSESFAAWLGRFVNQWELFGALCFVAVLIWLIAPVMEAAEVGLATIDWLNGGMRH